MLPRAVMQILTHEERSTSCDYLYSFSSPKCSYFDTVSFFLWSWYISFHTLGYFHKNLHHLHLFSWMHFALCCTTLHNTYNTQIRGSWVLGTWTFFLEKFGHFWLRPEIWPICRNLTNFVLENETLFNGNWPYYNEHLKLKTICIQELCTGCDPNCFWQFVNYTRK